MSYKPTSLLIAFILIAHTISAQPRNAGRMVVPRGYEQYDSIRIDLGDIGKFGSYGIYPSGDSVANLVADSLQCTSEYIWDDASSTMLHLKGKRKMTVGGGSLTTLAEAIKSRYYYALPQSIPLSGWGFFWKYNVVNTEDSAKFYNNTYDSNDISPYAEYPANHDTIRGSYHTQRWLNGTNTIVDSTIAYGDEGKPILAYSDDRIADHLLRTDSDYTIPRGAGGKADAALDFSTTLKFNIDTSSIDTVNSNGRNVDDLPLLRLQVLYKQGNQSLHGIHAWHAQPFTPFRDASHDTTLGGGWYKVTDVIVTRRSYRGLDNCWHMEDQLANGFPSHSWTFKQLHVLFQSIPTSMRNLILANVTNNDPALWQNLWSGPSDSSRIWSEMLPDSIVNLDASKDTLNLLEFRVFSTYRAKVRVCGIIHEDTIADKFLYRKRYGTDSTHSLNPNGTYGGLDDAVDSLCARAQLRGDPAEFILNDVDAPIWGGPINFSYGMIGYMDYMAGKHSMAPHHRPQESNGENPLYFRRNRMVFDGQPPSMIENQHESFSWLFPRDYVAHTMPTNDTASTFPDIVGFADTVWLPGPNYNLLGMQITLNKPYNHDTDYTFNGDTLASYKLYTIGTDGLSFLHEMRRGTRNAMDHPIGRRMAYEWSALFGFNAAPSKRLDIGTDSTFALVHGVWVPIRDSIYDSLPGDYHWYQHFERDTILNHAGDTMQVKAYDYVWWFDTTQSYYSPRPITPEELSGMLYGSLANGVSSFTCPNPFNVPNNWGNRTAFLAGVGPTSTYPNFWEDHLYNFGHEYGGVTTDEWTVNDTNDIDGNLPYFYLGYSNNWRAWNRVVGKINTVYDSANTRIVPHPLKDLRWLDAYSNNRCDTPSMRWEYPTVPNWDWNYRVRMDPRDSISKAAAFIKIQKTVSVNPWRRRPDSTYMDLTTADPDTGSYVEVGLFEDSINTSQKNYAALVVNTRLYPDRDSSELAYYNTGLALKDQRESLLGDIDVRKVYLKLDPTKCDPTFQTTSGQPQTYYVVRDLWHPDSTWLLDKDSTFAVYIKPGDAKFLYFEKGIAVNVAARTGTDTGQSSEAEFGFNNGRRVAEIMHGTHDVITYTRNNHLYVSYPAAGGTFHSSPDQSSGDNIITGYELGLDTTHTCARPSISVAPNDTAVALTYWYLDGTGNGHISAAYRKDTASSWVIVHLDPTRVYPDASSDNSLVTPVITPISDTAWLIVAGQHPGGLRGSTLITVPGHTPYTDTMALLFPDYTRHDGSVAYAQFQTVGWRPKAPNHPPTQWTTHMAWQIDTTAGTHQIYFTRYAAFQPPNPAPAIDAIANVSGPLNACDNIHPSLALNGTVEPAAWLISGTKVFGSARFYHDNLAWETTLLHPASYFPVIRTRHEADTPFYHQGWWGVFNVFKVGEGNRYPQVSADFRTWNSYSPSDSSHDWVRLMYESGSATREECWAPNWLWSQVQEYGYRPSVPQTTNDPGSALWSDSGVVPRSISWVASGSGIQPVRVTNGYMRGIAHFFNPNLLLIAALHPCDTPASIKIGVAMRVKPPTGPPTLVTWNEVGPSFGGPDEAWTNPEGIPDVEHTSAFAIQACDSILVPRSCITNGITEIQDSLRSGSDYVQFRLLLSRTADSSAIGTIDSMRITRSAIRWAGITPGIDLDTARYEVPCTASSDSAFVMMEVLRGDTTNSIHRYYVDFMDTMDSPTITALKRAEHPASIADSTGIQVTVHPNPARTTVEICVEDLPEGVPASAIVVNEAGQTVATLYNATPEGELGLCMRLNCSNLPNGTYYAYVQNAIMGTAVKFQVIK